MIKLFFLPILLVNIAIHTSLFGVGWHYKAKLLLAKNSGAVLGFTTGLFGTLTLYKMPKVMYEGKEKGYSSVTTPLLIGGGAYGLGKIIQQRLFPTYEAAFKKSLVKGRFVGAGFMALVLARYLYSMHRINGVLDAHIHEIRECRKKLQQEKASFLK